MKKITYLLTLTIFALLATACEDKVDYVTPDWARPIMPQEGATVKIDFFKPDEIQAFTWEVRPNSTYKVSFDIDMHFQKPVVFDMGTADSLKITNTELLETLREIWPDFGSIKRFFWKVEQKTGDKISTTWRYFSAILSIESFTDARDGERYEARQFVMGDGSMMTIMAENLRAKVYSDGTELPMPAKPAVAEDPLFVSRVGNYYSWNSTIRVSWDEARTASLDGKSIQGICPDGWHVPSYQEYDKLRNHLGLWESGNHMKDPSYWLTTTYITNSSKMGVMASGYYWNENGESLLNPFESDYPLAGFWTSTPRLQGWQYAWGDIALEDDRDQATVVTFYDDAQEMNIQTYGISGGHNRHYPVRCIMDDL